MAAIGTIRKRLGWLLIVLMVLGIGGFLLMDSVGQGGLGGPTQNNIAEVNGNEISYAQYDGLYNRNLEEFKLMNEGRIPTEQEDAQLRQQTWSELMNRFVIDEYYDELGLGLTEKEKAELIAGKYMHPEVRRQFTNPQTGQVDRALIDQVLNNLDVDDPGTAPGTKRAQWNTFDRFIRQDHKDRKYQALIDNGLTVPTWMATMYAGEQSTVGFNFVQLPLSDIADTEIEVSDSDLKSFLAKRETQYEQDAARSIQYITYPITPAPRDTTRAENWMEGKLEGWKEATKDSSYLSLHSDRPRILRKRFPRSLWPQPIVSALDTAQVGSVIGPFYFQDTLQAVKVMGEGPIPDSIRLQHIVINLSQVQSQAEADAKFAELDSLVALLDSNEATFEELAPQFSDDARTASKAGDLGWMKSAEVEALFGGNKAVADYLFYSAEEGGTEVLTSSQYVYHIVRKTDSKATEEGLRLGFLSYAVEAGSTTREEIYAEAVTFAGKHSTESAFREATANLNVRNADYIGEMQSRLVGLQGNARQFIREWVFSEDVEVGDVSQPYQVGDQIVVALLTQAIPEGVPSVDDIRTQLEVAYRTEKKKEMLLERAKGASGATLAEKATALGKTMSNAPSVSLANPAIPGAGAEVAVVGAALKANQGEVVIVEGDNGVYLIEVNQVNEVPLPADMSPIKQQRSSMIAMNVSRQARQALIDAADVEDDRALFF